MGIRFYCPNGHKLNVKSFQAGRRGICPYCGAKLQIPTESTRKSSKEERAEDGGGAKPAIGPGAGPAEAPGTLAATGPAGQFAGASTSQPVTPLDERSATASAPVTPLGGTMASQPVQPLGQPVFTPAPANWAPTAGPVDAPVPTTAELSAAASFAAAAPAPAVPVAGGVADPLAEAPNVVWYVRLPGGGQFGPASSEVMRSWINDGRVSPDSLVWREGWRDWQEASATFPELGAGQAAAGPGTIAVTTTTPGGGATSERRSGGGYRPASRQRSNATNVAIITVLVLAVIILFVVFLWVLFREPAESAGAPTGVEAARVIDHSWAASPVLSATAPAIRFSP